MKNILFILLIAITLFSSCEQEVDSIFDDSAQQRVEALTSKYRDILTSPSYGWKIVYQPNLNVDVRYPFLLKFNTDGMVDVRSDQQYATTKSAFDVKMLEHPILTFKNYTDFNIVSDPGNTFASVPNGQGLGGDFEFYFQKFENDTLFMKEKLNGKIQHFVVASYKDVNDKNLEDYGIVEEAMKDIMNYGSYFVNFKLQGDADLTGTMNFDNIRRTVTINTYEKITNGENINFLMPVKQTAHYNYKDGCMELVGEFKIAKQTIKKIKFGRYDKVNRVLEFAVVDKNLKGSVYTANEPHRTLVGAYNTFYSYQFLYIYTGFSSDPDEYKKLGTINRFKSIHLYLNFQSEKDKYVSEFAIETVSADNSDKRDYSNYPITCTQDGENGLVFAPSGIASSFTDEMNEKSDTFFAKLIKPTGFHIIHEGQINGTSVFTLVDRNDARNYIPIIGYTIRKTK